MTNYILGSCSVMSFNVFDENRAISPFNYILPEPACHDTFTTPFFNDLITTPPFPLVEKYYECTSTRSDAFQNALGIAVGNATFWVPLILLSLLPLVYIFLNCYKDAPSTKLEYSDDEMAEAARHIGLILLRVRDGYFQSYNSELVEHCMAIMAALKAVPGLATDTQRRKTESNSACGRYSQSRQRRGHKEEVGIEYGVTGDDSDDEIDPIDDIAYVFVQI